MSKRPVTLEEMREIQLRILDSVHEFCVERGLRYSLGGGTLLGAVRHKGYIPWDDDIDIMLPRPDYERFLREYPGTHEHYAIQHYKNDPQCTLLFAKIYDDRTVLEEVMLRNGVYIDVFPIDGLPDESQLDQYLEQYNDIVGKIWMSTKRYGMPLKDLLKYYIFKFKYPSRMKYILELERFLAAYPFETSDCTGAITGIYARKEHMPAYTFKKYIKLPFEGKSYMAIADYDAYLTKHYGNYMELPPVEKRVTHKFHAWWK